MKAAIIIATYGDGAWRQLAKERALPSAERQQVPIYLWHAPEATIAQTRNEAAGQVSEDWLCFLDADDELGPGYIQAMERALEQSRGVDGTPPLLTPAVSYVRKQRRATPRFLNRGRTLQDDNFLVVGTLVERKLFLEVGGFSDYPHGFEDWSLWAKCWKVGAKIVEVRGAVYYAYVNPQSKHRQGWRDRRWQVETHMRVRAELFPELQT